MKIAILYHYYSKNLLYDDNYRFFLEKIKDEKIDIYISSNKPIAYSNSNIINLVVDNVNFDYGGFSKIINKYNKIISNYDYVFFINNSVRGPFFNQLESKKKWYTEIIGLFEKNTGIVGSVINLKKVNSDINIEFGKKYDFSEPFIHVQSSFFVLPKNILKKLYNDGFFNIKKIMSYYDVVVNYEILLSQKIISYGFNLKATLNIFNNLDYRELSKNFYNECTQIDFENLYKFLSNLYSPNDFIFIKTNRRIISHLELWISSYKNSKKMGHEIYKSRNLKGLIIYIFYDIRQFFRRVYNYLKF